MIENVNFPLIIEGLLYSMCTLCMKSPTGMIIGFKN